MSDAEARDNSFVRLWRGGGIRLHRSWQSVSWSLTVTVSLSWYSHTVATLVLCLSVCLSFSLARSGREAKFSCTCEVTCLQKENTHTDQYLNFALHHPLQHKLSVVRTLLDRCSKVVSEEQDRVTQEAHIQKILSRCGYPEWSIRKVKSELEAKTYTN